VIEVPRRAALATLLAIALVLAAPVLGAQAPLAHPADAVPRGYVRLTLPVATRDLARGETVREGDVRLVDTLLVWRGASLPSDTTRVVTGWVTRRPVLTGELLRVPAVMPPPVVTLGTRVSAIYQDGPVRLVLSGVATNTAPLGAPVGVRVDDARTGTRRLDGIAVAPNTVRLR
jgi:flagella basal body P-ring formation protein FlgA